MPYTQVSERQIKQARAHARANGPGVNVSKKHYHRITLDMNKVDHFIDFINRPYFHQDVAFGMRSLKLDSGETLEMPNIVRTVTRSTMISQYVQFCSEESFEPLSRATLYRILEVREASQRRSLAGLDNIAADGSAAFKTLYQILQQLEQVGVDRPWILGITKRLEKAEIYLKTEYKDHCEDKESMCADHCRPFSLSDPADKDLQSPCEHQHTAICTDCEDMKSAFRELLQKLDQYCDVSFAQELREDLIYDCKKAHDLIFKWKAHILRAANQEQAKQKILGDLDDSSVLIVMGWAMKFVQRLFREKQSDWFGKRGLSWHISSVISKDSLTNIVNVTSFVHLFTECSQDWFAVVSIIEDLLKTTKENKPSVTKAFLRSDEGGCYHNNFRCQGCWQAHGCICRQVRLLRAATRQGHMR